MFQQSARRRFQRFSPVCLRRLLPEPNRAVGEQRKPLTINAYGRGGGCLGVDTCECGEQFVGGDCRSERERGEATGNRTRLCNRLLERKDRGLVPALAEEVKTLLVRGIEEGFTIDRASVKAKR